MKSRWAIVATLGFTADFGAAFAGVEVIYGLLSNSMALVADAGHNLGDVLGLIMAWVATVLARRAPSETHTYGLRRGTILAALANAMLLLVNPLDGLDKTGSYRESPGCGRHYVRNIEFAPRLRRHGDGCRPPEC
jgi:hypothetical protein